ncbi:MAG: orotate phosphoribosyltransferase [Alphaproteobacteria bacterium]
MTSVESFDNAGVIAQFKAAGALLEGHFVLSSGAHSAAYLQCARVMMDAGRGARLCAALAAQVGAKAGAGAFDMVASPAMGGVVVGYEMGRQLGIPAVFFERIEGEFALRRGFEVAGKRCLMVEDVVTTGLSSRECLAAIVAAGGIPVAAASLVDRSGGAVTLGVPLVVLATIDAPIFPADAVPDWLAKIPATKPGSRGLK